MTPRNADDGFRRWRCRRDRVHTGAAVIAIEPKIEFPSGKRRMACPWCGGAVELEPIGATACEVCGDCDDLHREMAPSGSFEWYCPRHDPRVRHEVPAL